MARIEAQFACLSARGVFAAAALPAIPADSQSWRARRH